MVVDDYAMSNYFTRLHTFLPSYLLTYIHTQDRLIVSNQSCLMIPESQNPRIFG